MVRKKARARAATPARPRQALNTDDLALLATLVQGNQWSRSLLCTLARRGVALRRGEPARARALLDEFAVYPLFKAGRFLFDLLEIEDFMIDGDPPPILPNALDATAVLRLASVLRRTAATLDSGFIAATATPGDGSAQFETSAEGEALPPLEPGYYLYEDVVLGVIALSGPIIAATRTN